MAFYIFFMTILNPTNFGSGCKIMFLDLICRITFLILSLFSFLFQLWNFFRAAGSDIVIGTSFLFQLCHCHPELYGSFSSSFFLFSSWQSINISVCTQKPRKIHAKLRQYVLGGKRKAKFVGFFTLYTSISK